MVLRPNSLNEKLIRRIPEMILLTCLVLAAVFSCGAAFSRPSQSTAQQSVAGYPARLSLKLDGTGTVSVGNEATIHVSLLDQFGRPLVAPWNITMSLIATTLENSESAKKLLKPDAHKLSQKGVIKENRITLQFGEPAARITWMFAQGQSENQIKITSLQKGRVLLFAESENLSDGETTLIVVDRKYDYMLKKMAQAPALYPSQMLQPAELMLIPIRWKDPTGPEYWIEIVPPKPKPYLGPGIHYAQIEIALRSKARDDYLPAPTEIKVFLDVTEGNASFEEGTLTIPKGSARSATAARLACVPGGSVTFAATPQRIGDIRLHGDNKEVKFPPGIRSTKLKLRAQPDCAVANGLDAITITAETWQAYDDHEEARTAADEGMGSGRTISFRIDGDSRGTSFVGENGSPEITIGKDSSSGSIKLFGRQAQSLKVVAISTNGKREEITSTEPLVVSFSFPLFALILALVGGGLFPSLRRADIVSLPDRADLGKIAWGVAIGGVFFVLALFGAISSEATKIQSISVTITKLPTEQPIVALVIGFLGSALWGGAFATVAYVKSKRGGAKRGSFDTNELLPRNAIGSESDRN